MDTLPHDAQLLARGRTAAIYALNATQILKLFWSPQQRAAALYEADIARRVAETGYPVPAPEAVVTVGERPGILYARVKGVSLLSLLLQQPERAPEFAREMAELHAAMHAHSATGLPRLRERLEHKIRSARPLPPASRTLALETLARLPDGDRLCHGDFHPDNILVTASGPVVIDWTDACCGSPCGDVARALYLLERSAAPPDLPDIATLRQTFSRAYRQRYAELQPLADSSCEDWMRVIAAARLSENIPEEQAILLDWLARQNG